MHRQGEMGFDVNYGASAEFDRWYARVGYRSSALVALARLARDTAREYTRRAGGWARYNLDAMDLELQSEYSDSRRFGTFLVEEQAGRVAINGKSQMTAYEAWNMCIVQWETPFVHRSHSRMEMP